MKLTTMLRINKFMIMPMMLTKTASSTTNFQTLFERFTDNNPIEYVFTRDSTDRVVPVHCCLKNVTQNNSFTVTPKVVVCDVEC